MTNMFDRLKAPFPPARISWRVGATNGDKSKGLALAYIDARDVMERLDEVCGPENWQCDYPHANGKTVCAISVRIVRDDGTAEWISKADGAGDSDVEAEKGALSDSFKRAAVKLGIARYLYDIPSPWVAIKQAGKSYTIVDTEYQKLEKVLAGNAPKPMATAQVKPATKSDGQKPVISEEFDARVNYMVTCRDTISAFQNSADVKAWWVSDERAKEHEQHQLEDHQIEALKQAATNRYKELLAMEAKEKAA